MEHSHAEQLAEREKEEHASSMLKHLACVCFRGPRRPPKKEFHVKATRKGYPQRKRQPTRPERDLKFITLALFAVGLKRNLKETVRSLGPVVLAHNQAVPLEDLHIRVSRSLFTGPAIPLETGPPSLFHIYNDLQNSPTPLDVRSSQFGTCWTESSHTHAQVCPRGLVRRKSWRFNNTSCVYFFSSHKALGGFNPPALPRSWFLFSQSVLSL